MKKNWTLRLVHGTKKVKIGNGKHLLRTENKMIFKTTKINYWSVKIQIKECKFYDDFHLVRYIAFRKY